MGILNCLMAPGTLGATNGWVLRHPTPKQKLQFKIKLDFGSKFFITWNKISGSEMDFPPGLSFGRKHLQK